MSESTSPVRLRGLRVDKVARLRSVNLRFNEDAGIVEISGRNEQGKTTLVELVWVAMGGSKLEDPIHHGAERGEVQLNLDVETDQGVVELVVRRIFTRQEGGGTRERLEVLGPAGKLNGPQGVLTPLLSKIAWDPYAWLDLARGGLPGRRAMVAQLLEGLQLQVSERVQEIGREHGALLGAAEGTAADVIASVDKAVRTKRTAINAQLEEVRRVAAFCPEGARVTAPDTAQLVEEEQRARRQLDTVENWQRACATAARAVDALEAKLAEARITLASSIEAAAAYLRERGLTGPEDATARAKAATEALANASKQAVAAQKWADYDEAKAREGGLAERAQALTKALSDLADERVQLLAGAGLPAGLEIGEDGTLTLKGAPFPGQASGAEQILTALEVCAATNPRLRLVRVRDGNRLDTAHFNALDGWLRERGYLALVEVVDESGQVGIVLEDGEVVADNRPQEDSDG